MKFIFFLISTPIHLFPLKNVLKSHIRYSCSEHCLLKIIVSFLKPTWLVWCSWLLKQEWIPWWDWKTCLRPWGKKTNNNAAFKGLVRDLKTHQELDLCFQRKHESQTEGCRRKHRQKLERQGWSSLGRWV